MVLLFAAMMIGHIVILAAGFAWVAYGIGLGSGEAWTVGVLPFIAGSVVNSALGATLLPAAWRFVDRRVREG